MQYFEEQFPGWTGGVNFKKLATFTAGLTSTAGATTLGATTVSSLTNTGASVGSLKTVTNLTAATAAPTAAQSGTLFTLGRAAGITVTLPAPVVGLTYEFLVTTSVTSTSYKIITDAGTTLLQGAYVAGYATVGDVNVFESLVATSNISVNMNGTTSGGLVGTLFRFDCLSSTLWNVSGTNFGSGTMVTSFATT